MAEAKSETKAESKKQDPTTTLPEGWELAHESEGYFIASKLVDSLGQQRVSESGADMAELVANCEAYDAHLGRVAEAATAAS